ncbi:hypothetical protein Hamer_G020930 [Homarus americanus]|uniref:Uncharacterized protein n=1 Tax=Homarus americanus TaxID=6706 RepID=A0A8J5JGI2_HOMAM|nr:hypothetical protein Hamer_G020930 [Homarus americanus]
MKKSKDGLGPGKDGEDTVTLRRRDALVMPQPTKPPSSLVSPYSFMRRSCTFVAESSLGLRKSGSRTSFTGNNSSIHPASTRTPLRGQPAPAANKVVKDRKNLAMQVRQKKDMLEESTNGRSCVDGRVDESVSGGGRMSRLVGGLRAWSSTEDVRQSVMGAIGRTVSVIKQKPVSRKVKQAFGRPDPTIPETSKSNLTKPETSRHITPDSTKYKSNKSHITKNTPNKTQPSKVPASKKTVDKQLSERVQPGKPQSTKFQFGRTSASRCKSTPTPVTTPAHHTPTTTAAHHKSQDPK